MQYMCKLADGTLGTIDDDTLDGQDAAEFVGEVVNVHTFDELGNLVERSGRLVEVFPYRSIICSDPVPGLPR